jgi:hypothetical protein
MVKDGLVEPGFLGIIAFPTGLPKFQHWWEWTLIAIVATSGIIGILSFLWYSYHSIRGLFRVRVVDNILS